MGFDFRKWFCNDGYGDFDFEPGSHMFLKIAEVGDYAICVQSNTSSKTSPPLVLIPKSVYKNGGRGGHVSTTDIYVMLDDMGFSAGREAPSHEVFKIRNGIRQNIESIRFYQIVRSDSGYEYNLITGKTVDTLMRALIEVLK